MKLISRKTLLLFFAPGAIFMGLFLIYPIIKMVFDSMFTFSPTGVRSFVGMFNYVEAFTNESFLKPLQNTIIYIVTAVMTELIIGFVFALF